MKRIFAFLLCIFLLFPSLVSCQSEIRPQSTETTEPSTEAVTETVEETKDEFDYPEIRDKLTWEKIQAFPIAAGSEMTIEEMRALCVDFFRFSKSALWTPDADFSFVRNKGGSKDEIQRGQIYGGMPYITLASCSIYRLMDWYDEETGVLDMESATKFPEYFGNQCSNAAHWAWARVINSAKYVWTQDMTEANGFLRVGPYTYDDTLTTFADGVNTVSICHANGEQTMYESYADLQVADGLVYYTTAGHVIMCTGAPVVTRKDGAIDPDESYLLITDQGQTWRDHTSKAGDAYKMKTGVDTKMSFRKLYEGSYLPFTFAEFLGTDPCEKTECTFDYAGGDYIDIEELRKAKVKSNYAISDLYAYLLDKDGKIVEYKAERAKHGSVRSADLSSVVFAAGWGKYCNKDYKVSVVCQLGTGERITLYEGRLTK